MKQIITMALALSSVMGFAQDYNGRVGINTSEPKATLHIKETIPTTEEEKKRPQGVTLPMLSTDQRALFENTQAGTMIYNTDKKCIDFYNGTAWVCLDGTLKEPPIAQVWDRTHYIASFNHNRVNIDGQITNSGTDAITLKIPYNGALPYRNYEPIIVEKTVRDRSGNNVKLTLNIPGGQFNAMEGFLTATIKVGNGTTDVYKVKQLAANKEELIASFNFSIGGREASVRLIANGGVLDKNFTDEKYRFIYLPISVYEDRTVPASGQPYEKKWLNNNLGAYYAKVGNNQHTQQATSNQDYKAYGSLFQWMRKADGHELVTWSSISSFTLSNKRNTQATSWDAGHNEFIYGNTSWTKSDSNDVYGKLWTQNQANNPCPTGFHVPSYIEWNTFYNSFGGAQPMIYWIESNPLHLPPAHYRRPIDGEVNTSTIGGIGLYWTSTNSGQSDKKARAFFFTGSTGNMEQTYDMAFGFSVRCIAD